MTRVVAVIPKWLRRSLARLALLGGSLISALVVAEFVCRALAGDAVFMMPRYVTHARYGEFEIRRNVPNARYTHTSADGQWRYLINSQGFRDTREFAYEKPPGRVRVLALGDSYTLGFEVGQGQTYGAVLERWLRKQGIDAEVINAGVSGFSTAEELVFLRQEGLRFRPDVVILGFFGNDVSDNVRSDLYRLKHGELDLANQQYLPSIGIRNLLNSFWVYRWLSENSYIHNWLNAKATVFVRDRLASKKLDEARGEAARRQEDSPDYANGLARALVREVFRTATTAGAKFIMMDIPSPRLVESFPVDDRGPGAYADSYVDMAAVLSPYEGLIDLYRPHGFEHWTEFSHMLAGIELGKRIMDWFPR
jgi:hypothetical protein